MHVARVRKTIKGKTYESALLRQSYRLFQQVKHRTLASLTALPPHVVDAIEGMLKGESWVPVGDALIIQRSWPHGRAAAVLGSARRLELESLLDTTSLGPALGVAEATVRWPGTSIAPASRIWAFSQVGLRNSVAKGWSTGKMASGRVSMAGPSVRSGFRPACPVFLLFLTFA